MDRDEDMGKTWPITPLKISDLKTQVQMIQSDATALVNSAKGDFPSQTSTTTSSVDALKTAVAACHRAPELAGPHHGTGCRSTASACSTLDDDQ